MICEKTPNVAKKAKAHPITAFKRSVTFDGRGRLGCEVCGTEETITPPAYPEMPKQQLAWTLKLNARILGFLKKHRECK